MEAGEPGHSRLPSHRGPGGMVGRIYAAFLNSCAGFAFGLRTERAIRQEFALLLLGIPAACFCAQFSGAVIWLFFIFARI